MAATARDAALLALIDCRKGGAWADGALKERLSDMDRREAALASRLCYGVLQNRILLDHHIDAFARGKLQPVVRDILRLAVYQLEFTDNIPAAAAVHEAVEQTKRFANPTCGRSRWSCPPIPRSATAIRRRLPHCSCKNSGRRRQSG